METDLAAFHTTINGNGLASQTVTGEDVREEREHDDEEVPHHSRFTPFLFVFHFADVVQEDHLFATPEQGSATSTPFRRSSRQLPAGGSAVSVNNRSMRVECRPSPERLDAQLRQMVHRQDEFNQVRLSSLA